MRTTKISNGTQVRCQECGKTHIVRGITGNNLGWEDAKGWGGTYDIAHGFFNPMHTHTLCPIHRNEEKERDYACQKETYGEVLFP